MYRLFPCIPIFRVLIKSVKKMRIYDYVKNRIGAFMF